MKIFKFFAALLLVAGTFSCSSDSSSSDSSADYFNLTHNGDARTVDSWIAIKQEDFIEVMGETPNGFSIDFQFNAYGDLLRASISPNHIDSTVPFQNTFAYFNANTFTFEMTNLNTSSKTVTVNFSGKVYEDEYDYTSNFDTVSGSFKVTYTEMAPTISGLGTHATIAGQAWHGMEASSSSSSTDNETMLNVQNDSEYSIGIVYPYFSPAEGTFTFNSNTADNRIAFSKYDPVTHSEIEYNVNGTITYTDVTTSYVQGTFSLMATHPTNGSTITITNGTFKEGAVD